MNEKNIVLPGPRLKAAASFIRRGSVLADIGTDHALLPIYAVKNGLATRALATDVNRAPLMRAEANIQKYDVGAYVRCILTPGFDGLGSLGITDAAICGMGGELIADIVSSAEFIRTEGFRLIIQPMTRLDAARRGILQAGFSIVSELTVFDEGKYYTVICADFDGICREADDFFAMFGDFTVKRFESDEVCCGSIKHEIAKYERIIKGKSTSGIDVSKEREIVTRLSEELREDR